MHKTTILAFIVLFQSQSAISQADSLTFGLKGKVIRALSKTSTSPRIFYAGLKGEKMGSALLYKSEDLGKSWHSVNSGKSISPYASDIQAIAIASDASHSIYVGTWKDGLFKSTDQGHSWQKVFTTPSSDIRSIKTGIQTPLLVYASTSSFGVIKSTDGGETWNRNDPIAIDSTFNFAWSVEIDERNDSIVFAQTYNRGVWKSTDQGDTWNQVLDIPNQVCWDMKISKNSNSIWVVSSVAADTLSSIHYSNDHGKTWNEFEDVPQIGVNQINVVKRNSENVIFIGSWRNGVFTLEREKWRKIEDVDFSVISEILLNDDELMIGSWGNGIYKVKF